MKKTAIILLAALGIAKAQVKVNTAGNVGIGTANPSIWFNPDRFLHLNGNRPVVSLTPQSSGGYATMMFRGVSTNSQFHFNFIDGTPSRLSLFSYQENSRQQLVIQGDGKVGLGMGLSSSPQSRLHVSNGGIKLDGNNEFEFGAGVANKETSAGKIAYQLWSSGLDIVGAGNNGSSRRLTVFAEGGSFFNGLIYINGVQLISDKRVKKNIVNTREALSKILQFRSIDYLYIDSLQTEEIVLQSNVVNDTLPASDQKNTTSIESSKKSTNSKEMKLKRSVNFENEKGILQHGFVAQEVEKIMPELVKTQPNGLKSVNYLAVIPILVEAMKEQNTKIEMLDAEIKKLKKQKSAAKSEETKAATETSKDAILYQNTPNPFSGETQIKYYLPETTQSAFITITDLNGKQVKLVSLSTKGESNITLKANQLQAGMYIYTLVADGNIVDSKRMVIVE